MILNNVVLLNLSYWFILIIDGFNILFLSLYFFCSFWVILLDLKLGLLFWIIVWWIFGLNVLFLVLIILRLLFFSVLIKFLCIICIFFWRDLKVLLLFLIWSVCFILFIVGKIFVNICCVWYVLFILFFFWILCL